MRYPRQIFVLLGVSTILTFMAMAAPAHAQPGDTGSARPAPPKYTFSFSYTPVYQFETDLDSGGEFDVQRHFLRFDVTRIIDRQWAVGLGLSFDYEHWDFSGIDNLAGVDLWDEIFRPSISLPIAYTTANQWRLMMIPSVEVAGASGADTEESLSYGAVISAMRRVGPNLMIGVGAGVFDRLDEWEAFPFLAIDWKIDDRFRLSNPFRAGIAGPAGLELVYTPTDRWELGTGGAFRSYRFRLDDSSAVPDGIGEVAFWVAFLRLGRRLGTSYWLDLNVGALIDGEISIDDEDGSNLGESGTGTAPFVGMTVKGRF